MRGFDGSGYNTLHVDADGVALTANQPSINEVRYSGVVYTLSQKPYNVDADDPDTVIAAPASGKALVHVRSFLNNHGTADVEFQYEDTTATPVVLSPHLRVASNGGGGEFPELFVCSEAKGLNVNILGGSGQDLGLMIQYITVDV
jgi:hypothetical protein